jgi:hypothetical protein
MIRNMENLDFANTFTESIDENTIVLEKRRSGISCVSHIKQERKLSESKASQF